MNQSPLKKSMTACLCAALCIVLPQALRVIPGTDGIYGLVHMPVLLCAFACGALSGVVCAVLGLSLSCIVSGVPSLVMLPVLFVECLVGCLLVGLLKKLLSFQKTEGDISLCFAVSILLGRIVGGLVSALLFIEGDTAFLFWTGGYFLSSVPGMLIEMVLLPIVASALVKAGLIDLKVRAGTTVKDGKS